MKISKSAALEHYLCQEGWHKYDDGIYVSIWAYKKSFHNIRNVTEVNCGEGKEMVVQGARHRHVPFTLSEKYPDGNAYHFDDIQKFYHP